MKLNLRHWLFMGAVFFLTLLFVSCFAFIDTSTLEDSIWMKPALDVMQGKILFRDTFSGYGMLVPLLQAAVLRIFGAYSLILRFQAAFFYALSISLLFLVWLKYTTVKNSLAAVFLWLILLPFYAYILLPWSSVYALDFQAAAMLLMILGITDKNRWFVFFAGASTTMAFLSRQPVGIFLALAVAAFYILNSFFKKKERKAEWIGLAVFFSGCAISFLPFLIYLVRFGALKDWWIQSFLFAREFAVTVRGISPDQVIKSLFLLRFLKDGTYLQNIIWLAIPLSSFYMLYKAYRTYRRGGKITNGFRLFTLAGLFCGASWLQYYPEVGPSHFFWADTPVLGFFVFAMTDIIASKNKKVARMFSDWLFVPLVLVLSVLLAVYRLRLPNYTDISRTVPSLAGIRLTAFDNTKIDSFRNRLTENLGSRDTYVNLSDDALVTLLDKRFHSIGPLYMQRDFIAAKVYPDYYRKAFTYINRRRPVIVTRTLPYIGNYCLLGNLVYTQPQMGIHIPAERVLDATVENGNLTISSKRDLEIASIGDLTTSVRTFTVPDVKKLKIEPVTVNDSVFPLSLKRNTSTTLLLKKSPANLVILFEDKDIESCMFPVSSQLADK